MKTLLSRINLFRGLINVIKFPYRLTIDFIHYINYCILIKDNTKFLQDNRIYHDWIYRLARVYKIPHEISNHTHEIQESWALSQINQFGVITEKLGINNMIAPAVKKISDSKFAVIMDLNLTYLNIKSIFSWLFKVSLLICAVYLVKEHIDLSWFKYYIINKFQ